METKNKPEAVKTPIGAKREGNKIHYDFSKKTFKLRGKAEPYDHYEEEQLLPLVPYYSNRGSQTLTWQFTVPTSEFWLISDPSLLMNLNYQIKEEEKDQEFRSLSEKDRIVPNGFTSAVTNARINCNGSSLNFALPSGSSLARFNNLGLRTTSEERGSVTDEIMYLINTDKDESSDPRIQSTKLSDRLSKIKFFTRDCDVPIPLFFWPFKLLPLYADISNSANLQVARLLPEKANMRLALTFLSETDLVKHVANLRKPTDPPFELKVEVKNVYLRVKKYRYDNIDKGLLGLYRSFAKKHVLSLPYLAISEASYNIEAKRSVTQIKFSPSSFQSKLLMVYLKSEKTEIPDDKGNIDFTKFFFPTELQELDITMGKDHLVCTPVKDVQGDSVTFTKIGFHERQIAYHRYKCGPLDFFSNYTANKFVIIDLSSYLSSLDQQGGSLPDIEFKLTWMEATKSPANTQLCIYSLNQKNVDLDMSGQESGLSAILSD